MNEELIQKLVDQCVDKRERHGRTVEVLQSRKFVELIVRECATAIITDSRLNDVRSAANGCVRTIREHFGVEE